MKDFEKVVRPGEVALEDGQIVDLFCKIVFKDGTLSITGIEGSKHCGQILDLIDKQYIKSMSFAEGWDSHTLKAFLHIWNKWHLNHLIPACEHQRELGWKGKKVEMLEYGLNSQIRTEKFRIKESILQDVINADIIRIRKEAKEILSLEDSITLPAEVPLPEHLQKYYRVCGRKWANTAFLYPSEHPEGILRKPCPVCGYEYGTAWHKVEIPNNVISFLQNLPDADKELP